MKRNRSLERLFHLTPAVNWPSIERDGLLSTRALLDRAGVTGELRAKAEGWRPDAVPLPDGAVVGDQWCQPPEALRRCLTDGLTPQDWYDRLNGLVFLWPDETRALRHARTYRGREQLLLIFKGVSLLEAHRERVSVTSFNVGYALRRAKLRNFDALVPYSDWLSGAGAAPVEVVVEDAVSDALDHLIDRRTFGPI